MSWEKRRIIEKIKPTIAYDYHVNGMRVKEVGKKHGICESTVRKAKDLFSKDEVNNLFGGKETVIIIPQAWLDKAMETMREFEIPFRLAAKEHEIIEKYQSKINEP